MALNPNIILGGRSAKFESPDPVEQYSKGLQLKGLMSQQALADQSLADDRSNRDAFAASGGDSAKYLQALASNGNYKAYATALKQKQDQEKSVVDMDHTRAQTAQSQATAGKTAQETRFAAADQHARAVVNVQTPQDVVAYVDAGIANGVFPKEAREQMLQKAAQAPSIEAWKQQQQQLAIPVLERFKQDAENSRNTANNQTRITTTQMTNDVAKRGQDVSASTARRGQDMTNDRARDFNATKVEENNIKRDEKKSTADLTKNSQIASFDTMLGTLDRLSAHPGLKRSVGAMGALPTMPGSESANFQAELNTFQSQAFLPMVAQLKGMGALSDAEGKKLTAAVGALDPKMGEKAFRDSVTRITADMEAARERMSGSRRSEGGATGTYAAPVKTKAGASVSNW